jgi:hypothetical protein
VATPRERWLAARAAGRRARPAPTARSCLLLPRPDGRFDVLIHGTDLRSGGVPPMIRVGGRPVRRVEAREGTLLRGVVDGGEPGDEVTVDLGPAGQVRTTVGRPS